MKLSTLTMAFITIMIHILLLLTAFTLQESRSVAQSNSSSNFLGASTYRYSDVQAAAADEDRTMRVLVPNKYK
jgi:hypothetical protein